MTIRTAALTQEPPVHVDPVAPRDAKHLAALDGGVVVFGDALKDDLGAVSPRVEARSGAAGLPSGHAFLPHG